MVTIMNPNLRRPLLLVFVGLLTFSTPSARSQESSLEGESLNREAVTVLETYCHGCHGVEYKVEEFDILKHPDERM